jgi:hypothetical protein
MELRNAPVPDAQDTISCADSNDDLNPTKWGYFPFFFTPL